MKSTSSIAIILTLLVLTLVLLASLVFLFQGRRTLLEQRAELSTDNAVLQGDLSDAALDLQSVEGTRIALESELGTAVDSTILLEGQLVDSQQEVNELAETNEALNQDLQSVAETVSALEGSVIAADEKPPEVEIITPSDEAIFAVGDTVDIRVVTADGAGVAVINITLNDEPLAEFSGDDATLVTVDTSWTTVDPGEFQIEVVAVNVNGRGSEPTAVTIGVLPQTARDVTATAEGEADPNGALRAEIEANVISIRDLEPQQPVTTTLLTSEELRQRVETDLFEEYGESEAFVDYQVMNAFDLLPDDFPLFAFLQDLYSEQIAGFYDPETDEFVVISGDETLGALEQFTYAHEYVHALQDQNYDLSVLDDETLDDDAGAAYLALIEGDASLVQSLYLLEGYVDLNDLFASASEQSTEVLDSAPPFLANSLRFPYETGLVFADTLYRQDGTEGLEAAWDAPPTSTEQIIHPDRFLAGDTPQLVSLPPLTDTLGSGWTRQYEDVLGEFMLREYLSQQLNPDQVETAATGWGGDRYALYTNETDGTRLLVVQLTWDTDDDATEFAGLYPNYPANLFESDSQRAGDNGACWQGESEVICLFQNGRDTTLIRAPDLATVTPVAAAVGAE